jgi:hypothetical protein
VDAQAPFDLQQYLAQFTPEQQEALKRRAVEMSWRKGNLRYLLHDTQKLIDAAVSSSTRQTFFLLCSRRLGKSYYLLNRLFSRGLTQPNARLLYLLPWARDAAEIALDVGSQILEDCPGDLRPDYNSQDKAFYFKNGSILRLKGVNGEHARYLRGTAQHEIVLDEVGLMDDLKNVVSSVCMPMTMTTGGLILMATTPPASPGHDSIALYHDLANSNAAVKFTIRDAPESHIRREVKRTYLVEAGEKPERVDAILDGTEAPETTTAQREYFCEIVTDASKAVVPEFTKEAQKEIVREHARPEMFDAYVSMDPGFEDQTGILFAYWDFLHRKLVIEDELMLHRAATPQIADAIRETEERLWGAKTPYARVSDVEKRLIADLRLIHDLDFRQTAKENSLSAVNLMRTDVQSRTLVIHPRCVNLIRQLENAIWNNRATDFQRAGEGSIDAHYDLVAALKYLCRSVSRDHNPYPDYYFAIGGKLGLPAGTWVSPKSRQTRRMGFYPDTPLGRRLAGVKKK